MCREIAREREQNPNSRGKEKREREMDLQAVKDTLECGGEKSAPALSDDSADGFYDLFISHGIRVDKIEPGRIICSFKVPQRLLNTGNFMHGGATASLVDLVGSAAIFTVAPSSGVSIEINVSYLDSAFLDEELEIEAKVLRVGKAVGVVSVELRKKSTGKIVAQGRHTKYLAISSKL